MKYGMVTFGQSEALLNKIGGVDGMNNILSGKWVVGIPASESQKPGAPVVPQTDTIVRPNRSLIPSYPEWYEKNLYPELVRSGPESFDLATLDQYLYGKQKTGGYEEGNNIHQHLLDNNLLEGCLNLQDLLAIQALGIKVFRKQFKDKAVFGWKDVVRDHRGFLDAPCLVENDGRVVLDWDSLARDWHGLGPALRFADLPLAL